MVTERNRQKLDKKAIKVMPVSYEADEIINAKIIQRVYKRTYIKSPMEFE
jgi:hypothetical protein